MKDKGLLITFEGLEGSGKTTQAKKLCDKLAQTGFFNDCLITREPGGTELGQKIRKLLLEENDMTPLAELFLFLADRNEHIHSLIRPTTEKGGIVVCDRFYHSSLAYQAAGRQLNLQTVENLIQTAVEKTEPDITFYLDISPQTGFERKKKSGSALDRIEKENLRFHQNIRDAYLGMKDRFPYFRIIDGSESPEIIQQKIVTMTGELIQERYQKKIL